jgi:hypothetical protein
MPQLAMTAEDLFRHLETFGISRRIKQMRVTMRRGAPDLSSLELEVTHYALRDGKPYFDAETHEPAMEVRRIPIASLQLVTP